MKDIYYIVVLDKTKIDDLSYRVNLNLTTIKEGRFCGKIINETKKNIYFELNESAGMVIIPHEWIKFMAPSKVLWDRLVVNTTKDKDKDEDIKYCCC